MYHGKQREITRHPDGYCLATAEILYHMPDHPSILQSYVWQKFDLPPEYPELRRFLDFWSKHLDGALHSVRVAHSEVVGPRRYRRVCKQFLLH